MTTIGRSRALGYSSGFALLIAASPSPGIGGCQDPQGPGSPSNSAPADSVCQGCRLYNEIKHSVDDTSDGHCESFMVSVSRDGACGCQPNVCTPITGEADLVCAMDISGEIICDFEEGQPFSVRYNGGGWVPVCDDSGSNPGRWVTVVSGHMGDTRA